MNTATAPPTDRPQPPPSGPRDGPRDGTCGGGAAQDGLGAESSRRAALDRGPGPAAGGVLQLLLGRPPAFARGQERKTKRPQESSATTSISLVSGQAHTLEVSDEVAATLGIRKGDQDSVAVAQPPTMMRPLVLPGSTALDPTRLARIRARFAPARVVEIAQVRDPSRKAGPDGVPRAEAGRHRLEGRSPGGFLQRGRGLQEERSPGCPGATGARPEDLDRPREHAKRCRRSSCSRRARRAGRPQRRSTGPSTTSSCGRSPRRRSTRFMPRPRRSVPTRTRGSRPRRAGG